jgi:hypothetical protein
MRLVGRRSQINMRSGWSISVRMRYRRRANREGIGERSAYAC